MLLNTSLLATKNANFLNKFLDSFERSRFVCDVCVSVSVCVSWRFWYHYQTICLFGWFGCVCICWLCTVQNTIKEKRSNRVWFWLAATVIFSSFYWLYFYYYVAWNRGMWSWCRGKNIHADGNNVSSFFFNADFY